MKLIKKIAAIMFAFMMIVSMSCNVKAEEGEYGIDKGTITINDAQKDQTYRIYRILRLESFSEGNYSYTVENEWKNFFVEGAEGFNYMTEDKNGFMSFKNDMNTEEKVREFAQKALLFAKGNNGVSNIESITANSSKVEFKNLELGYYLVDSTVGALCNLTTTNLNATIQEKNGLPLLEKYVFDKTYDQYRNSNAAELGDTVKFKTTITAKPGVEKYTLHDTMDNGLTFKNDLEVKIDNVKIPDNKMAITYGTNNQDRCTFEIKFDDNYLNSLFSEEKKELNTVATYTATVNKGATNENDNKVKLEYGDNNYLEDSTKTFTFSIPVFKYTKTDTPLAGAVFVLSKDAEGDTAYSLIHVGTNEGYDVYRLATDEDADSDKLNEISTTDTGKFKITGLRDGVYYLKEVKAPKGYNLLKDSQKIVISELGGINLGGNYNNGAITGGIMQTGDVKVQNKSGTLLPSTGGAGTTMIYLVGALLVLGSGVVLASKRRSNSK